MRRLLVMVLALSVVGLSATACKPQKRTFGEKVQDTFDPPKGPAEKAGRTLDRATDSK
ncbi:hypothetical protein [Acetobacter tropicalis]|uniref:Lipoprotein n=1 Tax=Acetobacter tropicalis TaxID=104102 RepID=A0A094YMG7_9PROT|nr:hypothetical protein [Acetobacter tropicalis]KGB22567.1 hypothetical protein AtDm6_2148 [Acetobacter tropicalis]MBC9007283.1 hypothetical protein [Acetobacter tropicalis]MDO8171470.1 hypothetical protein [Acetobacter tropicalis]GAL95985.1 conserved hypothetical protein [Acetobacter tropicalis]GBR68735.1 hypothetical protein AA0312_1055 [Acetobacter tropicalis NRIC 0312]